MTRLIHVPFDYASKLADLPSITLKHLYSGGMAKKAKAKAKEKKYLKKFLFTMHRMSMCRNYYLKRMYMSKIP